MHGGGRFRLPPGAFTDDTSMAICLAESLIACGEHDPADQLRRYVDWYRRGDNSSTGDCFDIGTTTEQALQRFEATGRTDVADPSEQAAGNGSLMRLAPAPLFAASAEEAGSLGAASSVTTHAAPQAVDACRLFAVALFHAVEGTPREQVLDVRRLPAEGVHPAVAKVVAGSYLEREPPAIEASGYVVKTLEAALWAVATTGSFSDAVLRAVNLGDDADTVGAVTGQLAGALYGEQAIPEEWRTTLFEAERIGGLADALIGHPA
jgi:ADP-ribosyl-[dinitrogen reductase] hydrolase